MKVVLQSNEGDIALYFLLPVKSKTLLYVNKDVGKFKTLWEGHKIWKKSPLCFDVYSVASKKLGGFSNFCGLLRKPEL